MMSRCKMKSLRCQGKDKRHPWGFGSSICLAKCWYSRPHYRDDFDLHRETTECICGYGCISRPGSALRRQGPPYEAPGHYDRNSVVA